MTNTNQIKHILSPIYGDMETQQIFRPIATNVSITTRNKTSTDTLKIINEWTADNDFDDLLDMYNEEHKLYIEYRLIVAILIIYNRGDISKDEFTSQINSNTIILEFIKEITDKNDEKDCHKIKRIVDSLLFQILLNICKLNSHLNSIPTYQKLFGIPIETNDCISIFRGFNRERYKLLFDNINTDINQRFSTPTFLSTSINLNTALRFTQQNGIIWHIVIPKTKYHLFRYTYLGKEKTDINDSRSLEDEILLNLNTILEIKKIKTTTLTYNDLNIHGEYENTKTVDYWILEFIGYDNKPLSIVKLNNNLDIIGGQVIKQLKFNCGYKESLPDLISLGGKKKTKKKYNRKIG